MTQNMQVEMRPIDSIRPYPGNPRSNEGAVASVAKSIQAFGFRQPIVVDAQGIIVVGHTRWKAARQLGLTEVPVHVANELTEEQCRAYRIGDNRTNELAEWDTDKLREEFLSLGDIDISAMGFTDESLRMSLGLSMQGKNPDSIPKAPTEAITKPGGVWLLGSHRLMCGSALDGTSVATVTKGRMPLAITDPPFELDAYEQARALRLAGVKTAVVVGGGREIFALTNMEDFRLRFDFVIVYDRSVMLTGKSSLIYRHNKIMLMDYDEASDAPPGFSTGVVAGRGVAFDRDKWATITGTKCSVLQASVQRSIYGYGKPCDVFRCFVRAMDSATVYDPFGGSGTGMIACEIEGRAWVGMELEPGVCDIAVARWEAFTGKKAILEESK